MLLNGQPRRMLDGETSEDCLFLNVWAPTTPGPHPVYFFIIGGGNVIGSTSSAIYDLSRLAARGIVCVSIAYRLGALGLLDMAPLLGPDFAGSANNALRDIMMALDWTRKNIANFDGNPDAITVGGISAGATNAAALLAVPQARNQFQRAALFSGGQRVHRPDAAAALAEAFLAQTGLKVSESRQLLDWPANAILDAQLKVLATHPQRLPFRHVVDGDLLRRTPDAALRAGAATGLELLLTTTRDEMALRTSARRTDPATPQDLAFLTLDRFARYESQYGRLHPGMAADVLRLRALTAEVMWIPMVRLAEAAHAGGCQSVHMARFDFTSSAGPLAGFAAHGTDAPFWIGNAAAPNLNGAVFDDDAQPLADRMADALAIFIRTGKPQLPGSPLWPSYTPANRSVMILDRVTAAAVDPDGDERQLWDDWPEPMMPLPVIDR